ncbi:hypothetical protein BGW38_007810 [Lunasporangiospora selenospora]|uniref:Uncharacterized protein n=1 Tax=Lunasporangiospora selenospora TaxID=979761 RepID=A0A9P6G0C8_9FUNG|nr:hypothetical protein BGW38_007810 [Lunasporangiospora selenospora]
MYKWVKYTQMGLDRPLAMLQREHNSTDGTIAPVLYFHAPQNGTQHIESVSIGYNFNIQPLAPSEYSVQELGEPNLSYLFLHTGVTKLDFKTDDHIQVVLKHGIDPKSPYKWTAIDIAHPESNSTVFTAKDNNNRVFFLPGHYIQIRYTPLRYNRDTIPFTNEENTAWAQFKRNFGLGEVIEDLAYETIVEHMPFIPSDPYDNMTTVVIIRPMSNVERFNFLEEKPVLRDTLSSIGGLNGFIGSAIAFLFGASLLSPWGFIARVPYFQRRICKSLAAFYNNDNGLSKGPFTGEKETAGEFDPDVRVLSAEARISLLKEQIDELEAVLSDFYLDGSIFQHYAAARKTIKEENLQRSKSLRRPGGDSLKQDEYGTRSTEPLQHYSLSSSSNSVSPSMTLQRSSDSMPAYAPVPMKEEIISMENYRS